MPDPTTKERLKGLILSAKDLRELTDWPGSLIEDYLTILDNLITLATTIDVEVDKELETLIYSMPSSKNYDREIADLKTMFETLATPHNFKSDIEEMGLALVMEAYKPSWVMGYEWLSLDLDPSRTKLPGANAPAEDNHEGFEFHRYDQATEESVYFHWGVPDGFIHGANNVRGDFKLIVENPNAGADEVIVMGFEYKKITEGDVFTFIGGTTLGALNTTITAGEAAWTKHTSPMGVLDTQDWRHGDTILFRFFRDATNGADTYDTVVAAGSDAWVYSYHLEYLAMRKK